MRCDMFHLLLLFPKSPARPCRTALQALPVIRPCRTSSAQPVLRRRALQKHPEARQRCSMEYVLVVGHSRLENQVHKTAPAQEKETGDSQYDLPYGNFSRSLFRHRSSLGDQRDMIHLDSPPFPLAQHTNRAECSRCAAPFQTAVDRGRCGD